MPTKTNTILANIHTYPVFPILSKKYELAIADLSKAYNYFSTIDDTNANYALYGLGKSYDGLHDKEKAIQYFIKLDSNIQKQTIYSLSLKRYTPIL